ncbi:hypothetical protein PPSIR1_27968 [Plesiocystis pacifica SIR-1]|uniref:Uncharacterized protein n=1 Tax=Plesiocystis pacifica SIR-1 TaxID=391625 RepID=A6FZL6_9BACT|nr:hypothetical protein PPSIR1_27968 [Plesiocystis pacifica SIR-1]
MVAPASGGVDSLTVSESWAWGGEGVASSTTAKIDRDGE